MLKITDLTVDYPVRAEDGKAKAILRNFSYEFTPGIVYALRGSNGSGKTTLLNTIANVIPEHIPAMRSGSITWHEQPLDSVPLKEMFHWLSYQMADPDHQLFFPSLESEVIYAPENLGLEPTEISLRLNSALERFGLKELRHKDAAKLSAGQKKLVVFAVIDAMGTPIILLDEPSAGLSASSMAILKDWIEDMKTLGRLVIVADHNNEILALADTIIDLDTMRSLGAS